MKKIFAIICSLIATTAFAETGNETSKADSTVSFRDVESVVIYDNDKNINIELHGKKDDKDFSYTHTQEVKDTASLKVEHVKNGSLCRSEKLGCINSDPAWRHDITIALGAHLGLVHGLNTPKDVKLNTGQSAEIALLDLVNYSLSSTKSRHSLSIGFGMTWRNFRITDSNRFLKADDGSIVTGNCNAGQTLNYSRLKMFSLNVPVLWNFKYASKRVSHGISNYKILFGPIVNFNTYSSLKTRYDLDGKDVAEFTKIGNRQPVTVDIYGAIELVKNCGLYVRYSPMPVFKEENAPKICPLSFGLRVGF